MKGILLTILLASGFGAFVLWNAGRPVGGEGIVLFNVAKGDGPGTIAGRLEEAGLIRSSVFFRLTVWSRGHRADFKAGAFELSPAMSARDIESALTTARPVSKERTVTILEGWTLDDIAAHLEKEGISDARAFAALAGRSAVQGAKIQDWSSAFPLLDGKPSSASLEGYLFPDTYRVYADGGAEGSIRRMLANFEAKFSPALRAEAATKKRSVFEIVTMASVIEREVRGEEDRAMVSDLFWRRVDAGRGMEADSTVNYCTGKSLAAVSIKDTQVDCPWNTYKWRGLPAGPIGNPGLSAIIAAIRPKANPYWYFLTDRDGNVHYGKTLDDHVANKRKYLR